MGLMIFVLVLSVLLGLPFKNIATDNKSKRIYLTIMFGLMAFIAGFRATSVGIDTANYAFAYTYIRNNGFQGAINLSYQYEWGYLALNYVISRVFESPNALFIVISVITCGMFARTFYRYSQNVVMSTFLFIIWFFPSTLNTMRQYFALAIILAGLPYLEEKKTVKYLLFIALATLIHNTAIILAFFALFTLKKMHMNMKVIGISSVLAVVSLNFFDSLLSVFLRYFNQYERFLSSAKYAAQSTMETTWIVFYILIAIIYLVSLYSKEKKLRVQMEDSDAQIDAEKLLDKVEIEYFFCIVFIISIVCMVFSSRLWIVTRINSYFRFSICIILPITIRYIDKIVGRFRVLYYPIFYALFGYLGYSMFLVDGHRILPLLFMWS